MHSSNRIGDILNSRPGLGCRIVLQAFFDDSGKQADSDFVCLAGYLSHHLVWSEFQLRWRQILLKYGVNYIHMKELMTFNDHYKGWSEDKRRFLLAELFLLLRSSQIVGFGIAADAKFFRTLPRSFTKQHGDAATFCFLRMIRRIRDRMTNAYPEEYVEVVFDNDHEYSKQRLESYQKIHAMDAWARQRISSVTFGRSWYYTPLQAADVLAWETKRILDTKFKGAEPTIGNHMYFGGDTNDLDLAAGEYCDEETFKKHVDIESGTVKNLDLIPQKPPV